MKSLLTGIASLLLASFALPLAAQIVGSQDYASLPGNQDKRSRMAGFTYGNQYFLAYNSNTNGLGSEYPALYFGNYTGSGGSGNTPPTINFQNAASIAIPGVPRDQHSCHMAEALVGESPYIFQFKVQQNKKLVAVTYEKFIPPVAPSSTPTFSPLNTVSSSMVSQVANLFDVAAAPLHSKMYLFLLSSNSGSKANTIKVWSYGGLASGAPVLESSFNFNGTSNTMQAIDVTNVTLASGEQAIVVTVPFVASGKAQVKAWLFDGKTTTLNPVSLANPPYAQFPASVRVAYGPAQGTSAINSCTLFYAAVDNGWFGASSRIYQTQIALPAALPGTLSQSGNWNQLKGIWQNSHNGTYSQYPNCWTAFPVSIPLSQQTNGYADVFQFITLLEVGGSASLSSAPDSFVSSAAIHLKSNATTAGALYDSSVINDPDSDDTQAKVESWNLLGVITGLPPLPAGTFVTNQAPILQLAYDTSATGSKQSSETAVVTSSISTGNLPDSNFLSSASYSAGTKTGSKSSTTLTLKLSEQYRSDQPENNYDAESNLGFLIASAPVFSTGHYDAYASNTNTFLGVSTVAISQSSTTIVSVPFYLDNPSLPIAGYPTCIYESFPNSATTPLVTYPLTTDIEGWKTPKTLTNTQPLFKAGFLDISANDNITSGIGLSSTEINSYSGETTNTIDVGTGISFLGIKAKVDDSFTITSQTAVAFGTRSSSQILYPMLQDSQGYSAITLRAYFYRLGTSTTTPANWMPTIFTGSQPWLLTWKVESATPTGTTTAP